MNITEECPLGKTCFTEKDDIAKRCKWYISFMATGSETDRKVALFTGMDSAFAN